MIRSGPTADTVRQATAQTLRAADRQNWTPDELSWGDLRPELLTDDDRQIVKLLTLVEDHIPDYLGFTLSRFPTTGDLDRETYLRNREYFRFLIQWANDEDKHASVLIRYQLAAEISDRRGLDEELAAAGRKPVVLPYEEPLELFIYTFLQEKATQLFYRHYEQAVQEPFLADLLRRLSRDEARHFAFYSRLVEDALRRATPTSGDLERVKNVLSTFRMPLDGVLDGYWRMALAAVRTVGRDHTEAYDALGKMVRKYSGTLGVPAVDDLESLITQVRQLG
ncbi:acyl-ACP desaturase [Streptomyces sp. NPDC002588]|uniref:acyl-ACP desaturase n=1 Tax=Streptomyces sp. NPDC002588 TaxID=3154419 RepID=UPI003318D29E